MALILSRKLREEVVLVDRNGREIARVGVTEIDGKQVKLAFSGGSDVKFLRSELAVDLGISVSGKASRGTRKTQR
jgi:sRNA-binding carbon storage regulator CsrA